MAIASVPTKLPLATFARILGIHPLHFEGVAYTPTDRTANICQSAMPQYSWQANDRISREEIGLAIANAEEMIEQQLRFRLLPSWESDEWKQAARPSPSNFHGYSAVDIRGHASTVEASWGHIISGGIEAKTLLAAGQPINWSDEDGDGLEELGTVVVAGVSSAVAACEAEIYYPGHDGDAEWQIRPATAALVGTTLTITFKRELCIVEDILESLNDPDPADYSDDTDFLDEVDVYRHYNNPATQATLMWEPSGCYNCQMSGCSLCAYSVQTGCLHLRSTPKQAVLGWSPGEYDANTNAFTPGALVMGRSPDLVRLYYYAGLTPKRGCINVMEPVWARAVAYLACALLDRPLCDCTTNVWERWREDLAVLSGGDQTVTFSFGTREAAAACPFGTTRGALYAWQRVTEPDVAKVNTAVLV